MNPGQTGHRAQGTVQRLSIRQRSPEGPSFSIPVPCNCLPRNPPTLTATATGESELWGFDRCFLASSAGRQAKCPLESSGICRFQVGRLASSGPQAPLIGLERQTTLPSAGWLAWTGMAGRRSQVVEGGVESSMLNG